jgi:Tuberculosis necrotizing toxin
MRYRSLTTAALTVLALLVAPPLTAKAQACGNAGSLPDTPATTNFYEHDPLLGPASLPQDGPVAVLAKGYHRLGPKLPDSPAGVARFRSNYFSQNPNNPWNWPPDPPNTKGFDVKPGTKTPDETRATLSPGTLLDRFGYTRGKFLAPKGRPFGERALPPQALNTPDHTTVDYEGRRYQANDIVPPSNYHVYCVQNKFDVDKGPIAPWFEQQGRATQYVLMAGYVPNQPADQLNVLWLLTHGPNSGGPPNPYLVEVRP